MKHIRHKAFCVGSLMLVPLIVGADPIPTGAIDPATPSGGANATEQGSSIEGKAAEAAAPSEAAAGSSATARQSKTGAANGSGSSRPDSRATAETDQSATSPSGLTPEEETVVKCSSGSKKRRTEHHEKEQIQ